MMPSVLQFHNVTRCYKEQGTPLVILDQVNFSLQPGEMVALVAPSGAGKSSLLHIAGLLERPDAGEVFLHGYACGKLSDNYQTLLRRNQIGFVYQFHHLLPEFTALENVILPQLIAGVDKKTAFERAHKLLVYLKIDHRRNNRPSEMSGGEQQRTAIARAVANMPALLLADEPTGNLDPQTAHYVFDALYHLVRRFRLSVLIATHNHDLAARMDRCITIKENKIVSLF